ncbi:uncharacterized protein LOC110982391 [Acanthaster planci]|uniref:Uncharacterized protein LOC110982391 n=1 Tax=Acanthaster planci TaxID=133434 RepID=A0A8B7YZ04_ACAPL|nr:uncharacterized protein LOC110982391 [Acanthaster planci]
MTSSVPLLAEIVSDEYLRRQSPSKLTTTFSNHLNVSSVSTSGRPDNKQPANTSLALNCSPVQNEPTTATSASIYAKVFPEVDRDLPTLQEQQLSSVTNATKDTPAESLPKSESNATVGSEKQDQPRQIISKQVEFDLASVLFAPCNTAASSAKNKKKHKKRSLGRSQSYEEIGTKSHETSDLKTGKRVTFKEEMVEIREAVENDKDSTIGKGKNYLFTGEDGDDDNFYNNDLELSINDGASNSSHVNPNTNRQSEITSNESDVKTSVVPREPQEKQTDVRVTENNIPALRNMTPFSETEIMQHASKNQGVVVCMAMESGVQRDETFSRKQEKISKDVLPVLRSEEIQARCVPKDNTQGPAVNMATDSNGHKAVSVDKETEEKCQANQNRTKPNQNQTTSETTEIPFVNPNDFTEPWTSTTKNVEGQTEQHVSDYDDDEPNLIIDESPVTQQHKDCAKTVVNIIKPAQPQDNMPSVHKTNVGNQTRKPHEGNVIQQDSRLLVDTSKKPENDSRIKVHLVNSAEASKQTSSVSGTLLSGFVSEYSQRTTASCSVNDAHPSLTINGSSPTSMTTEFTNACTPALEGRQGSTGEEISDLAVTRLSDTNVKSRPSVNLENTPSTYSTIYTTNELFPTGSITNRLLSPSYFQRSAVSATQGSHGYHCLASNPRLTSNIPYFTGLSHVSLNTQNKPDHIETLFPTQGTHTQVVWPRNNSPRAPRPPMKQSGTWKSRGYQTHATSAIRYQPVLLPSCHQIVPNRYVTGATGHQVSPRNWPSQVVRILQPLPVMSENNQPVRYIIHKDAAPTASASPPLLPTPSTPAVTSLHQHAPVQQLIIHQPMMTTAPGQQVYQQISPNVTFPQNPSLPIPAPSTFPQNQPPSPPPPPPPSTSKQSPCVRVIPHHTSSERDSTSNDSVSRSNPAPIIPNGTLFIQTPKGLVQLQGQYGHNRKPSASGSSRQHKLTKPTDGKVAASTSQDRGASNVASVPIRPIFSRVNKHLHSGAQTPKATTVHMKPGQTTGIRLPYQMLSQKQLLCLTNKTTSQEQKNQEEVEYGKGSEKIVVNKSGKSITEKNQQRNSEKTNVADEIFTKRLAVQSAQSLKGVADEDAMAAGLIQEERENDRRTGGHTRNEALRDDKEPFRHAALSKNTSPDPRKKLLYRPGADTGSFSKGRYVKFLDSSVTVNCIYVPEKTQSDQRRENDSQVTSRRVELSPSSKTVCLDDSDTALSDKDGDSEDNPSRKQSLNSLDTLSSDDTSHAEDSAENKSPSDDKDEWRPSVPVKAPSKCTRRFRNPFTGGLSKINIRTSRRSSGDARGLSQSESVKCATKLDRRHNDETYAPQTAHQRYALRRRGRKDSRYLPQISTNDESSSPEDVHLQKPISSSQTKEENFITDESNRRKITNLSVHESSLCSTASSTPPFKEDCTLNSPLGDEKQSNNTPVNEMAKKKYSTDAKRSKEISESKPSSPYKRRHLRSSISQSSDSDTVSSKYLKRVSFGDSESSACPENMEVPCRLARRNLRRKQSGGHPSNHAPLWQKVLRMLGLKKKRKPAREAPPGGMPWHRRRSSSVVLVESLTESAKQLDRSKDDTNDAEREKKSNIKAMSLQPKAKSGKKWQTPNRERKNVNKDSDGKPAMKKKGKQKAGKKQVKRRKLVRKSKISPQSLTDTSLTSIDLDARRKTRSTTRNSASSSSCQIDSSPSSSIRRGRRTLASISAQTWEDCYRCTYLKWKEAEISPENLAKDEGFKVMTNELGTPRSGPSKDKKNFQKLLMSKWEDIVQSSQTGSLTECEAIKRESQVKTEESILVETPPVAAEFSVSTSGLLENDITSTWITDTTVDKGDKSLMFGNGIERQDVDIEAKWMKNDIGNTEPSETFSSDEASQQKCDSDSYGMPPVLSPVQDLTGDCVSRRGLLGETFDTLESAKAAGYIVPESLTEETLRLLAEDGSIDSDLTGVQAFALFMPSIVEDSYDDSTFLSETSHLNDNDVSCDGDDENEVPPVISCHRLDNLNYGSANIQNDKEAGELGVGSTVVEKSDFCESPDFNISISTVVESSRCGFVDKRIPSDAEQNIMFEATTASATHRDCCPATDEMMPAARLPHSNEDCAGGNCCTVLLETDTSTVSLEGGEII